jgi:large subunit ribosomal protein L28
LKRIGFAGFAFHTVAGNRTSLVQFCFKSRRFPMAQVCAVCGKGPQFGNRISHAHNVTKRRWNVNLQSVRALVNGAGRRIRVCTSCIRNGKIQKAPQKIQKAPQKAA